MKLTKRQEKLAQSRLIGPSVIKGELGSGKTSIGVTRMMYLLEKHQIEPQHILFVTQDKLQTKVIKQVYEAEKALQNMSLFDSKEQQEDVLIKDISSIIEDYYLGLKKAKQLRLKTIDELSEEVLISGIKEVKAAYPRVKFLSLEYIDFLKQEIKWIRACGYNTLEAYQKADRKGATIRLPKAGKGRLAIWSLMESIERQLQGKHQIEKDKTYLLALESLKAGYTQMQYNHIIVDEAQDLTKVQLDFIKCLKVKEEESSILFLMDTQPSQDVNTWLTKAKGRSFKSIGYDMTGKATTLSKKKSATTEKVKGTRNIKDKPTPLEEFMAQQITKVKKESESQGNSKLPWYVETYKYINKATGVETIFQKDSSAGETYIDEVAQAPDEIQDLPIYSDIAAGTPIEIVDEISGTFQIPSELIHHKKNTYMLHVQGDSMVDADIYDGDYVVIQAGTVGNNEIAAVYYNGATTLKRIIQEEEHILLVSENPKYRPIVIEDGDFRVMGKLVGIVKPV